MTKSIFLYVFGLSALLLTGCTSDNEEPAPMADGPKPRLLTVYQADDAAARVTRTTLDVSPDAISAKWTEGDTLAWANLSRITSDMHSGKGLTAMSSNETSKFQGTVTCDQGDKLALIYPAVENIETSSNDVSYTISLKDQDGTLTTLASSFHFVYGLVNVDAVTETTAKGLVGKMTSLTTLCKFSFVDEDSSPILIKKLSISYGGMGDDSGNYPQQATVAIAKDENNSGVIVPQDDVTAVGTDITAPLTIAPQQPCKEVYVALLPTGQRTYNFTVTDDGGKTYSGTATAALEKGGYVEATGLKLTNSNNNN